jgi:hypothetical protein
MNKANDIIFCLVHGSLLYGLGWLLFTFSQQAPKQIEESNFATIAPAIRVKPVVYSPEVMQHVDKTIICGGGTDDDDGGYQQMGPTKLAGVSAHRC